MRDSRMKIGIIGYGNMGSAIAERIKDDYKVFVFDKDKNKTRDSKGVQVTADIESLAKEADVVVVAVKPQEIDGALKSIKQRINNVVVISIAAGIPTAHIEKMLGNARVIRVMPNLGAKIGESVSCLCRGKFATDEDLVFAQELFYNLGVTKEIPQDLMNAATAISGSGPAYIFDFFETQNFDSQNISDHARHDMIKRLKSAAESVGFNAEDASFLAVNTCNCALALLKKTKVSPSELRAQVTSKGGTTEAALAVIHKGGSWVEAAQAALKRAEELAKS